jgi:NADPH-dependent 2,4-dienoyl-CoA reductase/sulfur reductase-like enzyme
VKTIVVGYDGLPTSDRALDRAIELAKALNAKLHVVSVGEFIPALEPMAASGLVAPGLMEPPAWTTGVAGDELADRMLEKARERVGRKDVDVEYTRLTGLPDEALIREADRIDADLVVVGVGVSPDNSLAVEAGVPLGVRAAVAVDEGMRTGVPRVWAAGDCVETRHRLHDRPSYIPLGTIANKQGRVAGANIAGRQESFAGVVGTAAVKVFDLHVGRTGLSEAEAAQAGIDAVAATIVHRSRAHYYPGWKPLKVKLVAERGTGRLLGAQLAGTEGVAQRVDVVAAALHSGATVDEVATFDLSYAPPFAPVWDPLLVVARQAQHLV